MTRVILILFFVAAVVLAATSVMALVNGPDASRSLRNKEDTMPATFHMIAYVLLIILMFGVVTGWLGAA